MVATSVTVSVNSTSGLFSIMKLLSLNTSSTLNTSPAYVD